LLTLAAECGSELVIEAHGLDSQRAVECLQELIQRAFEPASEEIVHVSQFAQARPE
jgi:phosphotransferase system HPr-like phosphotransfer protein